MISAVLITAGVGDIAYTLATLSAASSQLYSTLLAFVGLGLLIIGILFLFATPDYRVSSTLLNSAISPPVSDLAMAIRTLAPDRTIVHVPSPTLGSPTSVFLVVGSKTALERYLSTGDIKTAEPSWGKNFAVLRPIGVGLLEAYEHAIHHDLLGLDLERLSRLLTRALVSELQLASEFTLSAQSEGTVRVSWKGTALPHQCLSEEANGVPELCSLCSSIACALAKASGRPVQLESSRSSDGGLSTIATYKILEEFKPLEVPT